MTKFQQNKLNASKSLQSSQLVPVLNKNDESEIVTRFDLDMNSKPYMNEKRAKNLLASGMKFQSKVDDRFFMIIEKHPLEKVDDI